MRRPPFKVQAGRSRSGQGMVEYAFILVLVAVVLILALTSLGKHTENTMGNIADAVGNTT